MRFFSLLAAGRLALLLTVSSAQHVDHGARDIFSPLESLVNSVFGITSTGSQTTSTILQTPVSTEVQTTATSAPEVVPTTQPTVEQTPAAAPAPTTESASPAEPPSTAAPSSPASSSSSPAPSSSSLSTANEATVISSSTPPTTFMTSTSSRKETSSSPANPVQSLPSSTPIPTQPSSSGSKISTVGIAIAVGFTILIIALTLFLVVRYHPATNAKYTAWCQRRREDRAFRPGLDDDEELGVVKAKAVTLTPIIIQRHRGLGIDGYEDKKPRLSEDTLVSVDSVAASKWERKPQRQRPFSFQFNTKPVPRPPPAPKIPRKPVPASTQGSRSPGPPFSPGAIGVALPLGTNVERKSFPGIASQGQQSKRWSAVNKLRRLSGLHELS